MGLKGKTEQKIHFASSFAITYPNNVLTIKALRDDSLYNDRVNMHRAYCCTLFIVCPSLFPVFPFVV